MSCSGNKPSTGRSSGGYTPKKAVQTSSRGVTRAGSTSSRNMLSSQFGTPKVKATFSSRGRK